MSVSRSNAVSWGHDYNPTEDVSTMYCKGCTVSMSPKICHAYFKIKIMLCTNYDKFQISRDQSNEIFFFISTMILFLLRNHSAGRVRLSWYWDMRESASLLRGCPGENTVRCKKKKKNFKNFPTVNIISCPYITPQCGLERSHHGEIQ